MGKGWKLCLAYQGVPLLINNKRYFIIEPILDNEDSPLTLLSNAKIVLSEDKRTLKALLHKAFGIS